MQYNQGKQHYRQSDDVQGKKPVQRDAGDQIVSSDPRHNIFAHHGNGAKQGNNDLRTPVGHLAPWQDVTHKCLRHQHDENQHAENPDQLSRLFVRAIHQRSHHMQVNHDKKRRGAGGVHVPKHPSIIDVAHDVLHRSESLFRGGGVIHGKPDTG